MRNQTGCFLKRLGGSLEGDDGKLEDDVKDDGGKGIGVRRHLARGLDVRAGSALRRGLVGFVAAGLAGGLGLLRAILAGVVLVLADEDAAAIHPAHGLDRGDRQGERQRQRLHPSL